MGREDEGAEATQDGSTDIAESRADETIEQAQELDIETGVQGSAQDDDCNIDSSESLAGGTAQATFAQATCDNTGSQEGDVTPSHEKEKVKEGGNEIREGEGVSGDRGTSSRVLTPFERLLQSQTQTNANATINTDTRNETTSEAAAEKEIRSQDTASNLGTCSDIDTRHPPPVQAQNGPRDVNGKEEDEARNDTNATTTNVTADAQAKERARVRPREAVVSNSEVTSEDGNNASQVSTTGTNEATTAAQVLASDAQAKERARVRPREAVVSGGTSEDSITTGRRASTAARVIASDTEAKERGRVSPRGPGSTPRRTLSNDACQTSSEGVVHGVQPLAAANIGTAQMRPSTERGNNNVNGAGLEEVLNDVQALPSQPSTARPPPSNPGAHSVGQPGEEPVPMRTVRYSLFGRLSDNNQESSKQLIAEQYSSSDVESRELLNRLSSSDLVVADLIGASSSVLNRIPSSDLAVAKMVNGSSSKLYEQAQVIEEGTEEEEEKAKNRIIGIVTISCLVFLAVTVSLAVLVNQRKASDSSAATETARPPPGALAPIWTTNETMWDKLPNYTKEAITWHPDSAQFQGYMWLLEDPNVATYPEWRWKQRLALSILYYATNGERWHSKTNWLSYEVHECSWFSSSVATDWFELLREEHLDSEIFEPYINVEVCGVFDSKHNHSEQQYQHLRLFKNNLRGHLPLEVYFLMALRTMEFFINDLEGTLSSNVGQLQDLELLDMGQTETEGSLPTELGLLKKLRAFGIHSNNLQGSIPSEIGLLENLEGIYLQENNLTSALPTEMGMLKNLSFAYLDSNSLQGPLPSELGLLEALKKLQLYRNNITGTIPTQFGQFPSLMNLSISENNLSGEIPTHLWSMESLENLGLRMNNLNGPLPEEVGAATKLKVMHLGNNYLSGSLPDAIYRLENLTKLFLNSNGFSGTISSGLGLLTSLDQMHLHNNSLSGVIPSEIGLLSRLFWIELSSNSLTGPLPIQVGQLSNLATLQIDSNRMTGDLPSQLGLLLRMANLNVSHNYFSGSVPLELGGLPEGGSLRYLNLSGNPRLSGTVPSELCGTVPQESKYYGECALVACGYFMECTDVLCGCDCECN